MMDVVLPSSVVSYQHCDSSLKVLVTSIQDVCPFCGQNFKDRPLLSPPIRFPSLLTDSKSHPYSVIIKPTVGSFLRDYKQGDNLHTGITDSKGNVFHFNERGMNYDVEPWTQCLAIPMVGKQDFDVQTIWDGALYPFSQQPEWQQDRYRELSYNCFDFVVSFLNYINYNQRKQLGSKDLTRQSLIESFILPATSRGAKYIGLLKSIQKFGYVIQRDGEP